MTEYPTDGTATDVTKWVGDDPVRAAEAQKAETIRDAPRKTVLEHVDRALSGATVTFRHADGRERQVDGSDAGALGRHDRHPRWTRT